MRVRFWGTRGSLPSPITASGVHDKIKKALEVSLNSRIADDKHLDEFITGKLPFSVRGSYGGNTACVEIDGGNEYVLCDAGTGLRDFGNEIMKAASSGKEQKSRVFNIFMSHLHWDHIQGFPFFVPAYIPGNRINVFGFHNALEHAFVTQQEPPFFPVPLKFMSSEITFNRLEEEREYNIGGFTIQGIKQNHPGDSYSYSFRKDGKKVVYSTDSEHKAEAYNEDYAFLDFIKGSDLLIFDAQYVLLESIHMKENWGHSSNIIGVELAVKAGVKRLCLFHNEPTYDDDALSKFLADTRTYLAIHDETSNLIIDLSYDGMELDV